MDGTLVDTEPYWMTAERELLRAHGAVWSPEDSLELVGAGLGHTASAMRRKGVGLSEDEIIDRLTERVLEQAIEDIPWRPGVRELLAGLAAAGVPSVLVTMSMRPLAEHVARAAGDEAFTALVTGGDVENPKPHPEPYLRAAALLGVEPADCVAIEDSLPGLASATAAGAAVIGVPAHIALPESATHTLWTTLAGRTVGDLEEVLESRRQESGLGEVAR
jgi:HAD superfamily hydrolase (TIGR01509 family)